MFHKNRSKAKVKNIDVASTDFGKIIITFSRHNGRNKKNNARGFICNQYGYNQKLSTHQLVRVYRAQQMLIEKFNREKI